MSAFRRFLSLAFVLGLSACSKKVEPAELASFIGPIGAGLPPVCKTENAGKRFALTGHLQLPHTATIEDGKVDLELFDKLEPSGAGSGRSVAVTVKTPGDIDDLWGGAKNVKGAGYLTEKGSIAADALKVHAKNGVATAKDRLRIVVELDVIQHFQTKQVTACRATFVEAEKL